VVYVNALAVNVSMTFQNCRSAGEEISVMKIIRVDRETDIREVYFFHKAIRICYIKTHMG
jgi:hypothetical protein